MQTHTEVWNIDLIKVGGFCRNCLSKWMRKKAEKQGIALTDPEARQHMYGMPYDEWGAKYQK